MKIEGGPQDFPEADWLREKLLARAKELDWYHSLRLDDTFTTPGCFALDDFVPYYLLPESLAGLGCLEVGVGNGYWSFLLERKGAAKVTGTDISCYTETDSSSFFGQAPFCGTPPPVGAYGETFRIASLLLGSKVNYCICNAYDLNPETVGMHDLVFCGSVLMHLFGPQLALQRMSTVCGRVLSVTTETDIFLDGESKMVFKGHEIPYVHYIPSPSCLVNMIRCCGFKTVIRGPSFHLRSSDSVRDPTEICHTTVIAFREECPPNYDIPDPRLCFPQDRSACLEIVSCPDRVGRGENFDVIARVTNMGTNDWRGDDGELAFKLGWRLTPAARTVGERVVAREFLMCDRALVDFLPAGLGTLARLRLTAPVQAGDAILDLQLKQGEHAFRCDQPCYRIAVT